MAGDAAAPEPSGSRRFPVRVAAAVALDLVAMIAAAAAADVLRFSDSHPVVGGVQSSPLRGVPYLAFGVLAAVVWALANASSGAYGRRVLHSSAAQLKTTTEGLVRFIAVLALTSYAARANVARTWSFYLLLLGVAAVAAGRLLLWRACGWLAARGVGVQTAIAVGTPAEVEELMARLRSEPSAGVRIVGAVMPPANAPDAPELGSLRQRVRAAHARLVVVAGTSALHREDIKAISDALDGLGTSLLVVPELSDTASTRLTIETVGTLPMLHVDGPALTLRARVVKTVADRTLAFLLLPLVIPLILAGATALLAGGCRRPFVPTDRVGLRGRRLRTWTLADATPWAPAIGRLVRRSRVTHLPWFLSVLTGDLSFVGPRAAEPEEVAVFGADARRRLSVRPGLTGLSQQSSVPGLSWSEMARLDLFYVQNWSLGLDISLLARAVLRPGRLQRAAPLPSTVPAEPASR